MLSLRRLLPLCLAGLALAITGCPGEEEITSARRPAKATPSVAPTQGTTTTSTKADGGITGAVPTPTPTPSEPTPAPTPTPPLTEIEPPVTATAAPADPEPTPYPEDVGRDASDPTVP